MITKNCGFLYNMNKKVLILNTGGTISSIQTSQGYQPIAGYVSNTLDMLSLLHHADLPEYTIKEYDPLLDSSNMTVNDWNRFAYDIAKYYHQYDGFIIFHGTDTMAYTASALSFMLENLSKPVILTGSQVPLAEARNDALDNIITSLWICMHYPIPEVCIYFNQKLLRGNRSQKISAQQFNAFDSPNYPHLAAIGIQITVNQEYILPPAKYPFHLQQLTSHFIANFRLFPGFEVDVLRSLLEQPLRALILETYGTGNAPNNNSAFLEIIHRACTRDIIIINSTQCLQGSVIMSQYATGHSLLEAGLISGYDMTKEAIHCKLLYLFSKNKSIEEIRQDLHKNLCGEVSL